MKYFFGFFFLFLSFQAIAQPDFFADFKVSKADSLRGQLTLDRTCYDVLHYDLSVELLLGSKEIIGNTLITFQAVTDFQRLQIDLFSNMVIDSITYQDETLRYDREEGAVFISFDSIVPKGKINTFKVVYHGQPRRAVNPPWDGGFTWTKDPQKNDWIVVNCQGIGASLWWPNKDHLSDEPDSMDIRIIIPDTLVAVSNGHLLQQEKLNNNRQLFHWHVSYPINNYNVTLAVGKYTHFKEYYISEGDSLDLDYYVLEPNLAKAKKHFRMVPEMLGIYEYYLDRFPFWQDGYALIETPSLGMEHQSAISYGNQYQRGYLGKRIPKDMNWDYIIVHESAHEYWGNSLSCNDLAEMWLHEGFTTYMEALYVEKKFGYDRAVEYLLSQKNYITNSMPILGQVGVNFSHMASTDQYFKGTWVLHSLRNAIDNDSTWFGLLKSYYRQYALSNVTNKDFVTFVNHYTGQNFSPFLAQYLVFKNPPKLLYSFQRKRFKLELKYKWETDVANFRMPIRIGREGQMKEVTPSSEEWQTISFRRLKPRDFEIDHTRAYFESRQVQK